MMVTMTVPPPPPGHDDKPAPMPLRLVQVFVNTLDIEQGTDALSRPDEARRWLAGAGLLDPSGAEPSGAELAQAVQVRAAIQTLAWQNSGGQAPSDEDLAPLRRLLRTAQPRLEVTAAGRAEFASAPTGRLADGLARLLLIIRDAQADGSWPRLKLCGNPDCRWAFYDRSHSRKGAWCDMASCGNMIKNRNLRARRAKQPG
jgi:predicted RNA-binding Zn ribbon-like protein